MKVTATSLLAAMALGGILRGEETIVPEFLFSANISQVPYRYNGLLSVRGGFGSASLVGEGVYSTAAHVVFDDEELVWEPISRILFYPRYHRTTPFNPTGDFFPPVKFIRWTSYATRVENDDSGPGLSSPDTFNFDFAAFYLNRFVRDEEVLLYPEVYMDKEDELGILRDHRLKTITGYPSDLDFVSAAHTGLMHATEPADYFCWWQGLEAFPDSWRDSEDYWVATYDFVGVTTYSGNSGGPMYIENDQGEWMSAGVVVGSNGSDGVLIRGIDENAWSLIEQAVIERDTETLFRIDDLTAALTGGNQVQLSWTDRSEGEARYLVYRKDAGPWELTAELAPDTTEFTDTSAFPGRVYTYRVQPVKDNGNRPPLSEEVRVAIPGNDPEISAFMGLEHLKLYSQGDTNWHIDSGNRLRAGKIRHLGASSLKLDLIGPGILSFNWSVSSEENPAYGQGGPDRDDIYDALFLLVNGEPVSNGSGEPRFLSGEEEPELLQLTLGAGPQTVEWRYEKDPYSSEGEDTGFLEGLSWNPGPGDPYPVYGAYAFEGTPWHGSNWFGPYSTEGFPWVGHLRLGWSYLYPGNGVDLILFNTNPKVGHLYTNPHTYPYLYHYGRESWVYFLDSSAQFGDDLWFYDLGEQEWFRADQETP